VQAATPAAEALLRSLRRRNATRLLRQWAAVASDETLLRDRCQLVVRLRAAAVQRAAMAGIATLMLPSPAHAEMTALPKVDTKCTTPSLKTNSYQ
jgi:hypothetical protein